MVHNRRKFLSVARTLLIHGGGKTEKVFANFLKNLFVERNCGVRITIDSRNGGSPAELIKKVSGKLERRSFDDCVVMMDTDLPLPAPGADCLNHPLFTIHYPRVRKDAPHNTARLRK